MYKMILILLALTFFACGNDNSRNVREQAAQNISQAQAELDAKAVSSKELTLSIGQESASKGDNLCLPVIATGFYGLISMQYSIRWDPKVLRFDRVSDFNLPWLSEDNFGMHITDEGLVTFVWIDNDLRGVNIDNGNQIYQLCFEVIGEPGQESIVTLAQEPTPFEVVTAEENIIPLKATGGKVSVQ